MRLWRKLLPLMVLVGTTFAWYGDSPNAQVCTPTGPQAELQYLRRLSLDLRGHLPTVSEMKTVIKEGKVSEQTVDAMISSPQMLKQLRDYHKDLLWANISNIRLANNTWRLAGNGTSSPYYLTSQGRKRNYRGQNVRCLNKPAEFNSDGSIKTTPGIYKAADGTEQPIQQEGYVMVKPYWSPNKAYKVCAFDAQDFLTVKSTANGRDYDCSRSSFTNRNQGKGCGCGPDLRWCMPYTVQRQILSALQEQTFRFIDGIIRDRKPYTQVITGQTLEVNGPISHYLQHQTYIATNLTHASPNPNHPVPKISYDQVNKWTKVERSKLHAGVLTMPLFLLKFSSDRGRANRFYNVFLCSHFQAPPGGLPPAQDSCHDEPDLMKRCGCKYCHQTVEPTAAYWGRWSEAGMAPLNPEEYPAVSSFCKKMSNRYNQKCRRFYFYPNDDKEMRYLGHLIPYLFSTPTMKKNIETGPIALAQQSIDDGTFASCTTRRMYNWFVGSKPHAQQTSQILTLADKFKGSNYDLLGLIKSIVTSKEYRQGRLLNR